MKSFNPTVFLLPVLFTLIFSPDLAAWDQITGRAAQRAAESQDEQPVSPAVTARNIQAGAQHFDGDYRFPASAFVGEPLDFSIKINTENGDNVYRVKYEWTFSDEASGHSVVVDQDGLTTAREVKVEGVVWNVEGRKSVRVTITNLDAGTAKTIERNVIIFNYPDNISSALCYEQPPATSFLPKEKNESDELVHILAQPFVGDLDEYGSADSKPEVVTTNRFPPGYGFSDKILVFDSDLKLKKTITTATKMRANTATPLALVRIKPTDRYGLIIAACFQDNGDCRLYAYTIEGNGRQVWQSNASYYSASTAIDKKLTTISPVIGDINNDGYPEILAGDRIFDAETGKLLVELPPGGRGYRSLNGSNDTSGENLTCMPVLADVDNDGYLEVVGGNTTYKVTITNRNGTAGNTAAVLSKAAAGKDGFTSVADIDLDGQLDVVVSYQTVNGTIGRPAIMVWNGATGAIIGGPTLASDEGEGGSRVFIGKMDKSYPYPEMAFSYLNRIVAFRYDPAGATNAARLVQKWIQTTSDASGATTLSMFDFDLDNNTELVYRDMSHLRIMSGITGLDKERFDCFSATHSEYPIIVDIDKDGHADIIVSGAHSSADSHSIVRLRRYSGANNDWAGARSVWNQHGYNSVHVNDDLTVPRFQLHSGTVFPGKDGVVGTPDDVLPYNGFLLQQTPLNRDGDPLYLTPDPQIENPGSVAFAYDNETKVLSISNLRIKNMGDAGLNAPVMISVYKGSVAAANLITTYSYDTSIASGEVKTVAFTIGGFDAFLPMDNLLIKVNDAGDGNNDQLACKECDPKDSDSFGKIDLESLGKITPYKNCVGGSAEFAANPSTGTVTYRWFAPNDPVAPISTSPSFIKAPLAVADSGRYVLEARVNNELTVSNRLPFLSVAPTTMYWKRSATDNNWNNPGNWASDMDGTPLKAIPASCTSVHIPGGAAEFPSLDTVSTPRKWYGDPEVQDIVFHYKGELAYPHKLIYEKAYVQYNWGYYGGVYGDQPSLNADGTTAPVLKRGTWHALAAPLKSMVSGDFSLAGYPFTWQAKHDIASLGTNGILAVNNTPLEKNDIDLAGNYNSIALKVAGYKPATTGYSDHRDLEGLKGVLQIPFFENTPGLYHPGQSYDRFTGISHLYYFNLHTLQQLYYPVGQKARSAEAYRFIYENDATDRADDITIPGHVPVPGYKLAVTAAPGSNKRVLTGNPFLASINAENFIKANPDVDASAGYLTYSGSTQTWETRTYTAGNNIHSFESFIVTLNQDTGTLYFPLEGDMALTGPVSKGTRLSLSSVLCLSGLPIMTAMGENRPCWEWNV